MTGRNLKSHTIVLFVFKMVIIVIGVAPVQTCHYYMCYAIDCIDRNCYTCPVYSRNFVVYQRINWDSDFYVALFHVSSSFDTSLACCAKLYVFFNLSSLNAHHKDFKLSQSEYTGALFLIDLTFFKAETYTWNGSLTPCCGSEALASDLQQEIKACSRRLFSSVLHEQVSQILISKNFP